MNLPQIKNYCIVVFTQQYQFWWFSYHIVTWIITVKMINQLYFLFCSASFIACLLVFNGGGICFLCFSFGWHGWDYSSPLLGLRRNLLFFASFRAFFFFFSSFFFRRALSLASSFCRRFSSSKFSIRDLYII